MNLSPEEFDRQMQDLDKVLGQEGVPVPKRPLVAATRFPCENKLIGSFPPDPALGAFEGPNLMYSIGHWYERHYPDQAVFPDRLHTRIVLIRGEPFSIRIPFILNAFGKLSVFDYIQKLSPALLDLLDQHEKKLLQGKFDAFYREASNILLCLTVAQGANASDLCCSLLATGWADLKSCGGGFNAQDPAAALFPAQQATEKYLKAFLVENNEGLDSEGLRKKYGHDISRLVEACALQSADFQQVIPHARGLSYGQEVRYVRPAFSLAEILDMVDLSHAICDLVACLLIWRYRHRADRGRTQGRGSPTGKGMQT